MSPGVSIRERTLGECKTFLNTDHVLAKDETVLDFWRRSRGSFPCLAVCAQALLCVPCTSTPSERVFSIAGQTVTAKRVSLSPLTVTKVLFIHENYDFCMESL